MVNAYNEAFNRFIAFTLIFALVLVFFMGHMAIMYDDNTYMQNKLKQLEVIIDRAEKEIEDYEKELSEYQNLLDNESDINDQLSATITELRDKLAAVESELASLEEEHKNCRKPIIYSFDNVLIPSNVTGDELASGLLYGLKDYAKFFVQAEEKYGINAIFLASVAALESGWCRSEIAISNNNLFGYKDSNSSNGFRVFASKEESIDVVARNLKINQLTEGGVYYNGLSVSGVNVKYCEGSSWSTKVDSIANGIIDRIYSA